MGGGRDWNPGNLGSESAFNRSVGSPPSLLSDQLRPLSRAGCSCRCPSFLSSLTGRDFSRNFSPLSPTPLMTSSAFSASGVLCSPENSSGPCSGGGVLFVPWPGVTRSRYLGPFGNGQCSRPLNMHVHIRARFRPRLKPESSLPVGIS